MSQKIRLGLSLYPEQESLEDIESYLKMASERGFTKAFTSLCVSGMAHILSVKVRPRVFVAKCSEPQAESREAGVKEAV